MLTTYKNFKVLSPDAMKSIHGGKIWTCTMTHTDGSHSYYFISANYGCAAQTQADGICWDDDTCTNIDCAGSGPACQ